MSQWTVNYSQADDDDILNQYVRLWFEDEDGNRMGAEEALKRINATEYLSAEDAEGFFQVVFAYERMVNKYDYPPAYATKLQAYAKTLRGDDGNAS